ncbi:hypothetical protein [Nostoc sp. ChiQUE01b]|uniref:hypothetical protein n=1 Tax=Nostoc sp. ChiQUE01b TaxID=3075376 RepID=UPI002AD3D469|nr:hypothetical protein [Nostoc sp. ChiQUE01b]MDZ8260621.1 hypothetical protein [Nostoc sp. ChiQUE01b]
MTTTLATQTSQPAILKQIADIRQQINLVAGTPEVLALVQSGQFHPDLRLGDAIQALDELTYGLQEFFTNRNVISFVRETQP